MAKMIADSDGYSVCFDTEAGIVLKINPHSLRDSATPEAIERFARGLCWDEMMTVAAERLAAESDDYAGFGDSRWGDQRDRLAFLAKVKACADDQLRVEIESLRREVAIQRDAADRCWRALGGGSDNVDAHMRACDVRSGRAHP